MSQSRYDASGGTKQNLTALQTYLATNEPIIQGVQSKNLFNKDTVYVDSYLNGNTGALFAASGYFASEYIPIKPNAQYAISNADQGIYYTSDKAYIDKTVSTPSVVTSPLNVAYIRLCAANANLDNMQLELGSAVTTYESYGIYLDTNNNIKDNIFNGVKLKDLTVPLSKTVEYTPCKNLFNKTTVATDCLINQNTGKLSAVSGYNASDWIKINPSTVYTLAYSQFTAFYDVNKIFISGFAEGQSATFTTPSNAVYIRTSATNAQLDNQQLELGSTSTGYENFTFKIKGLSVDTSIRDRLYNLKDAWVEWEAGSKFPVGFLGDSTTDGVNTTGWTTTNGHEQTDILAGGYGKADYICTKAYPYLLEQLIRKETGSTTARIYNIGYSGTHLTWANPLLPSIFNAVYSDTKMVGISYGINDRNGTLSTKDYEDSYRIKLEYCINWLYHKGIQPFLVTTQATIEPSPDVADISINPNRSSEAINSVANRVKKELAIKYNLEIIDMNKFDELFLTYSQYRLVEIMNADTLHFSDRGHQAEAEFLFTAFCPRVIEVEANQILGFTSQELKSKVPSDKIAYMTPIENGFKVKVDYVKDVSSDTLIQDFWVLNQSQGLLNLTSYVKAIGTTYVILNDVNTTITGLQQLISSNLDIGLHHIQSFTGVSVNANFLGFILAKV